MPSTVSEEAMRSASTCSKVRVESASAACKS
ncbi:Uncharacterised protein [Mycobacteroides abscessus subsp. abscessus]|nr:Uncharacterised protein [Mycobacteroides abscessus subsp. abscessus]